MTIMRQNFFIERINFRRELIDLKEQFSDQENHLGMVDDVLGTLLHHQDEK